MYSLQKASDVRELMGAGSDVKLLLALVYAVNDLQAKAGYVLNRARECRDDDMKAYMFLEFAKIKANRIRLYGKLKQLTAIKGYAVDRQMGGRIRRVYARKPRRGATRPPGGIGNISQKGLFVFSDMYTEEALLNLIVNETMFQE